jgi:hypothetical protein
MKYVSLAATWNWISSPPPPGIETSLQSSSLAPSPQSERAWSTES